MKLFKDSAEIFIPDGKNEQEAITRTTYMSIAAHQDDLEIMSMDGIIKAFGKDDEWYFGVVVTNGAGSPRDDLYADYTDEKMQKVRREEQKRAAYLGGYGALGLLDYTSKEVRDISERRAIDDIKNLIRAAKPKVIYTHNLADKHDTHLGVAVKVIKALRELKDEYMPEEFYGCEVWRALDWVNDNEKITFNLSQRPNISSALVKVFDSQICGGKRYDLATEGRWLANATFAAFNSTDEVSLASYAMNLLPLLEDSDIDVIEYVTGYIDRFKFDVKNKLQKLL